MSVDKAIAAGLAGNELSKKIVGSDDTCVERTVVATGVGGALGAAVSGAVVVTGLVSAPVVLPAMLVSSGIGFLASLFD